MCTVLYNNDKILSVLVHPRQSLKIWAEIYTRYMYNFCTLHTGNDLHKYERELVGALAWCIATYMAKECAPVFAAAHFPELSLEMVPTCWFFMTQLSTFISAAFPHVKWPLFHKKVTYFRIPCVRTNQWYFRSQALLLEKEHFPKTLFISLKNSNAENFATLYISANISTNISSSDARLFWPIS